MSLPSYLRSAPLFSHCHLIASGAHQIRSWGRGPEILVRCLANLVGERAGCLLTPKSGQFQSGQWERRPTWAIERRYLIHLIRVKGRKRAEEGKRSRSISARKYDIVFRWSRLFLDQPLLVRDCVSQLRTGQDQWLLLTSRADELSKSLPI